MPLTRWMLPVRRPCYNTPQVLKLPDDRPGTGILQGYNWIQRTPWRERRMATTPPRPNDSGTAIPRYDSFEDFYVPSLPPKATGWESEGGRGGRSRSS